MAAPSAPAPSQLCERCQGLELTSLLLVAQLMHNAAPAISNTNAIQRTIMVI